MLKYRTANERLWSGKMIDERAFGTANRTLPGSEILVSHTYILFYESCRDFSCFCCCCCCLMCWSADDSVTRLQMDTSLEAVPQFLAGNFRGVFQSALKKRRQISILNAIVPSLTSFASAAGDGKLWIMLHLNSASYSRKHIGFCWVFAKKKRSYLPNKQGAIIVRGSMTRKILIRQIRAPLCGAFLCLFLFVP